jgi:hypothetical protein
VWGSGLSDPACQCATAFTYQREVKGSLRSKVDHFASLERAGAPRGRVMGHSRVEGAENIEGHSAGRTGGASDLPELRSQEDLDVIDRLGGCLRWSLLGLLFAAALAYALPDLRAWWSGEPPMMIGGKP